MLSPEQPLEYGKTSTDLPEQLFGRPPVLAEMAGVVGVVRAQVDLTARLYTVLTP